MHVDARAQDEIRKRQFSEVPSRKWGTKHASWKGQLLSWVNTSISANRIMHHAPFIVTSIISVSLVTELISDQSKHALPSKISSCSFFLRILNYPQFLTIFKSSGKSSDDETKVEPYRVAKGHKLRRICSQDSYCIGFYLSGRRRKFGFNVHITINTG